MQIESTYYTECWELGFTMKNYHEFGIGEIYLFIISYDNCYIYDNLKLWIWDGGMLNIHKKNDNADEK